jgi:hypothetical protein
MDQLLRSRAKRLRRDEERGSGVEEGADFSAFSIKTVFPIYRQENRE